MLDYENYPIIAAVKNDSDFEAALRSEVQAIFMLSSNLLNVDALVKAAHENGKILFIHLDFIEGLSKDAAGVRYLATKEIDGIISTRSHIITAAKKLGILCVQRFFMVDSRSVDTALESLQQVQPDMIEIMPALAYKSITRIQSNTRIPIIAGGLIEYKEEIFTALRAGASMISTGRHKLWNE